MNKTFHMLLVGIVTLAALVVQNPIQAQAQSSPSTLLQQAIFVEETEGDLNRAVEIYQSIVETDQKNREVASQALYRLGSCQLKIGNRDEAIQSFLALEARFPNAADLVSKCRAILASLGAITKTVSLETVSSGNSDKSLGLLSPNENLLAYVNWKSKTKADGLILNRATGDEVNITERLHTDETTYEFATIGGPEPVFGAWSHDSNYLAFNWYISGKTPNLVTYSLNSAQSKLISTSDRFEPADWSPDNKFLLCYVDRYTGTIDWNLGLLSVEEGQLKETFKKLDHARFSLDGKWICGFRKDDQQEDIFLINLETKTEVRATHFPSNERNPAFSADGKSLIFISDRRGTWDLYSTPIGEEFLNLEPVLLRPDFGDHVIRATKNGNLSYYSQKGDVDIYEIRVPSDPDKPLSNPSRFIKTNQGSNVSAAFSKDGSKLAIASDPAIIKIIDQNSESQISIETELFKISHVFWQNIGDQPVAFGFSKTGEMSFFSLDLENGSIVRTLRLKKSAGEQLRFFYPPVGFNPTSGSIIVPFKGEDTDNQLYSVNFQTGETSPLHFEKVPGRYQEADYTPNGTKIAILHNGRKSLSILNLESQEVDLWEQDNAVDQGRIRFMRWDPTGKQLAYFKGRNLIVRHSKDHAQSIELPKSLKTMRYGKNLEWSPEGNEILVSLSAGFFNEISLLKMH